VAFEQVGFEIDQDLLGGYQYVGCAIHPYGQHVEFQVYWVLVVVDANA
jgi:hypothetical protein